MAGESCTVSTGQLVGRSVLAFSSGGVQVIRTERQGRGRAQGEGFQIIPQPAEKTGKSQKGARALLDSCGPAVLTGFEGPQSVEGAGSVQDGHHGKREKGVLLLYLPVQG